MDMIKIVNPPLSEYMNRVREIAMQYMGDPDHWFELEDHHITDNADRDEFSFIRMAVWDQLMASEFFPSAGPPQMSFAGICDTQEPGTLPGSFICDGDFWALINTQSLLAVC